MMTFRKKLEAIIKSRIPGVPTNLYHANEEDSR